MTRARNLSRLGNINAISVSEDNLVGIGSTIPGSKLDLGTNNILSHNINSSGFITATNGIKVGSAVTIFNHGIDVAGVVTATSFSGDGSGVSGVGGTDFISAVNVTVSSASTLSGPVSIADSITHLGDDNTHFGFPAADTFALSTGGVQRLNISQTVNITPEDNQSDAFSVKQGSNEYITVDTTNSSERVTLGNNTTNPEVVILSNTGIGTTNPVRLLEASTTNTTAYDTDFQQSYNILALRNKTDNRSVGVEFKIGTNGQAAIGAVEVSDTNTDLVFGTRSSSTRSEKVRITSGGDVGIGTDTPTDPVNSGNSAKLAVGIVTARQYFGDGSNLTGAGHAVGSGQTTITSTATFNNSGSFARFAEMDASYTTVGTGPILVTFSWSITQSTTSSDLSWKLFRKIGGGAASEILVNPSLQGSSSSGMIPNFRENIGTQGIRVCYSFIDSPGHSAGDLITYEHHINCEGSNTLNLNFGAQTAARHCTTVSTITFLELAS